MNQIEQQFKGVPDTAVIGRILAGEKDLFEVLMRRYNGRLFRIARSFINDPVEIEDIIQETYIKAYENLSKFREQSSFSTWLIRILINMCLARKSKAKRLTLVGGSPGDTDENHKTFNMIEMKTPEQHTINEELKTYLENAIDQLPEKYRSVFMMREIEKMSTSEAGDCLRITESNVKVRLNRAKEILKDDLSRMYSETEIFQFLGERCDRIVENVMKRLSITRDTF